MQRRGTTLYGTIRTSAGKPTIAGPLRTNSLDCPARGMAVRDAAITLNATADKDFAGVEGRGRLATGSLSAAGARASGANGSVTATWRKDALTARYSLAARGVSHPQAQAALLTAEGSLRARSGFANLELQSDLEGNGVRIGNGLDRTLAGAARSAEGTLLAPLLQQARAALARESRASRFVASLTARKTGSVVALVVPAASLRGGSGDTLLSLSQFAVTSNGSGTPRIAGNFATGGAGLPRIAGRMERAERGERGAAAADGELRSWRERAGNSRAGAGAGARRDARLRGARAGERAAARRLDTGPRAAAPGQLRRAAGWRCGAAASRSASIRSRSPRCGSNVAGCSCARRAGSRSSAAAPAGCGSRPERPRSISRVGSEKPRSDCAAARSGLPIPAR